MWQYNLIINNLLIISILRRYLSIGIDKENVETRFIRCI